MIEELCCPCRRKTALVEDADGIRCAGDGCPFNGSAGAFPKAGGIPVLIPFDVEDTVCEASAYANGPGSVYVRRRESRPKQFLRWLIFGEPAITLRNCRQFCDLVKQAGASPRLLVIGSGTPGSGTDALWQDDDLEKVGIDIYPDADVDFVADAHYLPFRDRIFDGVWIQAVLEHVLNPRDVVAEISRVLKPGGHVYAETPFMQQVHEGAYDFQRFTVTGHRYLFRDFALTAMGPNKGPAITFAWACKYLVWAITRSRMVATLATLPVFFLCRWLDPMFGERAAWDGASGTFFLGRKGDAPPAKAQEIIGLYKGLN